MVGEHASGEPVAQLVLERFELGVAADRAAAGEGQECRASRFDRVEPGGGVGIDHLLDAEIGQVGAHDGGDALDRGAGDGEEESALVAEVVVHANNVGFQI